MATAAGGNAPSAGIIGRPSPGSQTLAQGQHQQPGKNQGPQSMPQGRGKPSEQQGQEGGNEQQQGGFGDDFQCHPRPGIVGLQQLAEHR